MDLYQTIINQVANALDEDVGSGDISARLIDESARLQTELLVREDAILCGCQWFDEVFRQCDAAIEIHWRAQDGDAISAGSVVCEVSGPARGLLTAERSALNFLQTLSATATVTRAYADLIRDTGCRILDTRKTIPQLRLAQKYAVLCGGGSNHRIGLFDAYLIKENHLAASGGIAPTVARARELQPDKFLEIEVENLEQLRQAIDAGVDRVLLDNFSLDDMQRAVALNDGRIELEASGNIDRDNLAEIAATGVDYVSIGALTKHIRAIDFSLRYR
ncbi:MAG: carboxylating nicotinate-nucleotide diphosphorylase [Gammaproteobacteria bacterium]|nr:MAG: carboxylating nicotinate-nucleotide diphosphorylase [Gammaproteobacteria bacterium]UCH41125.1 MAG: carboxylating nicotinate-nucleotide diphosphorylase [Gammaproteobacteria bacterium]